MISKLPTFRRVGAARAGVCLPLVLAACLSPAGRAGAAPPLVLADGGRSDYRIVLAKDATPAERYAAEELRRVLKEMSGADLALGTEADPAADREICLNARARIVAVDSEFAKVAPGRDGYEIRTRGDRLLVAGDRPRGTLYAVYALLEGQLGCRWFTREVARIPKRQRVEVGPVDVAFAPPFEYREDFYSEAFDGDWAARNRMNGNHARLEARHGGKIIYFPFVHTFESILPAAQHFKDHPDWFAEVKGKRVGERTQLCLSNPEVLRLTVERVRVWMREHPDATIFSVSQNDWDNHCTCAGCRAIDEREGSPSGSLLTFVNAVAEAVEKDFPDKLVDTLAYQYTRKTPKTVRPRANVRVRLCSIECCFAHPLDSDACEVNRKFRGDLEAWATITGRLYVWDYVTDFSHYLLPFPNFDVLGANARFFAAHGVKGVFEEGNYSPGEGGDLSELRAYVIAKALWDPKTDGKLAIAEFTDAVYGPAGPAVRDYLELMHSRVRGIGGGSPLPPGCHLSIWAGPDAPHLAGDFLDRAEAIFAKGAEAAAGDAASLRRLRKARIPLDYLRLVRTPVAAPEHAKRLEVFVAVCKEFGITHVSEGRTVDEFEQKLRR